MNIHSPTPLRVYTGGAETVTVPGGTITEVFSALTTQFPDLKQQLFNNEGKLRSFVNVYFNDEDLRYLPEKEATPVSDADELTIIPSIAGGCCACCPLL
ncbi:MAG TPA: MoaD/ThiS family protein [Edaphobacter sp.]